MTVKMSANRTTASGTTVRIGIVVREDSSLNKFRKPRSRCLKTLRRLLRRSQLGRPLRNLCLKPSRLRNRRLRSPRSIVKKAAGSRIAKTTKITRIKAKRINLWRAG